MAPIIFHGTPLTPRAALKAVLPGRAACVSFYRPDDLEAVLACCPHVMFRPGRLLDLGGGSAQGRGAGRRGETRMVRLLRMARTDDLASGPLGHNPGHSCRAVPAQRRADERLAVWQVKGRAGLAHGRPNRPSRTALRTIRPGLSRVDRRPEARARGMRCLSAPHGRGRRSDGQHMAPDTYAARNCRGLRLSIRERRQHVAGAERMALRHGVGLRRSVGRKAGLC